MLHLFIYVFATFIVLFENLFSAMKSDTATHWSYLKAKNR